MPLPDTFRLADDLTALAEAADTKAERTRLRLLASAAALLDDVPFAQLRPSDLADHAELSRPLIYHYFTDLGTLVTELVETFGQRLARMVASVPPSKVAYGYEAIVAHLAWLVRMYLHNRGLMRLMYTLADQLPGVKVTIDEITFLFNKSLGDHVDAPPGLHFGADERLLAGYMIGGGFDDLLRQLFQHRHDRLPAPRTAQQLFDLVQLMAALRHRQVHGSDPSPKEIRAVAKAFDLRLFDGCLPKRAAPSTMQPRRPSMTRLRRMVAKGSIT
jgi:AcrR family transcriptional regulator